jgi:CubicO group peptidase (beta-lactamase class C family)
MNALGQDASEALLNRQIDSLVSTQIRPDEPGLAILVARKGKVIYEKAFGSANLELGVPMKSNMVFQIGSITKQFTAVAILQLAEQGRLSLQDSVQQYVKDYPNKGFTITIEQLLTHTSGIRDFQTIDHPGQNVLRWDFTPKQLIDHFKYTPLEFEPGTKYNYTNSGYVLLGRIIEVVSGQSYQTYLMQHVIRKAGLQHTFFANQDTLVPNRVQSYSRDKGYFENSDYMSYSFGFGCGDLLSTVGDLFLWHTALMHGQVIKKESLDKAYTPYKLKNGTAINYGYGWIIDQFNGVKRIHHEGQISGFVSEEKYFPEEDIFVATMANVKSPEDITDFSTNRYRLYEHISQLAIGQMLQTSLTLTPALLDQYVGRYALSTSNKRVITLSRQGKDLMGELAGQGAVKLLFTSDRKFTFEGITNAAGEFVLENGKVVKMFISQGGQFVWVKVK